MYRSKRFGVTNCKEENNILAKLERDLSRDRRKRKRKNKHEPTRRSQDTKPDNR